MSEDSRFGFSSDIRKTGNRSDSGVVRATVINNKLIWIVCYVQS